MQQFVFRNYGLINTAGSFLVFLHDLFLRMLIFKLPSGRNRCIAVAADGVTLQTAKCNKSDESQIFDWDD